MSDNNKVKKPIYKRVWFWVLVAILIIILVNATGDKKETGSGMSGAGSSATVEKKTWDADAVYAQINNGMTKAEVDKLNEGKTPSCYESVTEGVGTMNICTYGNLFTDKKAITVTYLNDAVYSKSRQTN